MLSEPILSVRGIAKGFDLPCSPIDRALRGFSFGLLGRTRRHEALRDVSFDVRRGETVALLGVNGAGKSTLLQMIAGTMTPSAGLIEVRGRVAALLQLGAGFSPDFTGRENATLNARLLGIPEADMPRTMDWILAFSGIGDAIDRPVRFYSSGMFVRLAFSVAAASNPDIMIIDEALGVGDAAFQAKCHRYLKEDLSHVAKLIVSHDRNLVGALAERVVVLAGGRVAHDGSLAAGLEVYDLAFDQAFASGVAEEIPVSDSGFSLSAPETFHDGRRTTQAIPGQDIEVRVRVVSGRSERSLAFLSLMIGDAYGQRVVSNDHSHREAGLVIIEPGDNEISAWLRWPRVRSGQYVLRTSIDDMPTGPSGKGRHTGPGTHTTLNCLAPADAVALLTVPVEVSQGPARREIAS